MNIFETSKRRMTLMDAFDLDPDKVAEQHRIGKAEGIPASFVDDDMRRLHRLDQTEHKLQGLTVLPRTISADPNVAAMAKDDLDRLAAIENISKFKRQQKERDAEARRRANEPGLLHEAASSAWSGLRSVFNNIDIVQADAAQTTLGAMEAGEGKALQYHRQGMPDLLNPNFGANPYELNNPLAGAYDPEDLYQKKHAAITQARDQNIAEYEEDLDAIRPTRSRQTQKELEEYSKQAGLGSSLAYLFTHPRVMTNLTAESGGAMLPAIAAATASGGVGGAPAFAAAFGAGSGYQEYSGTLADRIEASSAQTQKSRADILADRELMEAIRHEARTRGVVIGAVDTATFGLTGLAYNAFKNRVARWAAGTAVQAGGGAAGEAGAQLATHGEITDWPSVAAEMALEVVMGAPEVAAHARFAYNQLRSEQEQDITNLTAMTDAARASKLNQRAPDVFRGLAEQIEENADIQHYYVDGNALHQSGLVAALETALPDRVGEIRQALETGGSVQIPAADILTKIAPDKGLEDAITPHLRTADGLSLHELETTGQAELEGDIARNVARAAEAETRQTEADAIRDDFAAQITATGRMTRDAALQNAALPAAFYQTVAEHLGISVSEAYEKYKLNVVGEPLVGLNQEALPGTYFRRNNRDEPYNDDFVMMFADKTDRIEHYGENLWQIPPDSGVRVRADSEEFRAAMREWLEDNETWFREMGYANEPGWMDTLMDLANPDDIVDSAGFWDIADRSIMRYFDEEVMQPNGWDVVETYDGAIAFNPDIVERVEEAEDDFDEWLEAQYEEHKAAHPQQEDTENKQGRALEGDTVTHHVYDLDLDKTWAFTNAEDAAAFQQRKGEESGDASRFSLHPVEKPYVLRKKSAGTLNQDPVPSGDFSAQTTEQQHQFAETAQQYGGEEAYAAAKADGETNLTYRQWVQVRTPAFKEWFGDWENNPSEASKVIDPQTGEPLVVYHGTPNASFDVFDARMEGQNTGAANEEHGLGGFYFTPDAGIADTYARTAELETAIVAERQFGIQPKEDLPSPAIYPVFLNIRNPLQAEGAISRARINQAHAENRDGIIKPGSYPETVAFNPNQIKSAIGNNGAFDANHDSILHQNADAPRGAFDPSTNTIALLEKADLSTFIHELGHFYFETLTRIANDLRARDDAAGGGTLTEGEIQILKDVDTLIGKAGHTLDDWNQMTLEERRYHHETVARQFEAYLMEGKAPSVELQGIFSRLRSWLFAVYKKLTALNVQLDDDVRQVFDRMLASDEAIQIAEQNRSMMPLFSTPEAAGMTAEQFADYQRQFQGASDAALDEMSLRMLADAKAIGRLKHRALKAKDKEAKILRGETEIEARNAIMAQPVYRVWQMLSGKMNADTTIASNQRPWTDAVAPEHDDLFTAIAKIGGINRQEIERTWGFDPADKISSVKPGFFVLRREGGQSLDGMRQALVQYGYLTESDSLNDFYELFEAQRRGDTQYSNRHQPDPGSGKTGEHAHLHDLPSFRLDYASLAEMGYGDEQIAALGRKVKKKGGIHPDLLAELVMDADGNPVYDSGDALVQALLAAPEPKSAVRAFTDRIMLERHGELATPEAISEAADMAAHNDLRLRVLATEYNALAQASGGARLVQSAARQLAAQAIGQKRIRDLSPAQYTRMETRAAKAALAAMKKGDIATAAAEKRNQVLQASLARAAHEAKVETKKHALYLRRMNKLDPKTVAIEEREQIEALLERYNLRDQSGKALDRRQSLAEWVQAQREQGIEPDIAPEMLDELKRQPWQTLTVDELRGLVDTVRQIEHRGRTKNELLTARKKEDYNTAIENMVASIDAHARVSGIENRTPTTKAGKAKAAVGRFFAAHLKTAMLARRLDGDTDGGAVWEYFIRPANAAADRETTMRAEATAKLTEILAPLIRDRAANRKKSYQIAGKTRSFTHNDIFVMALNRGNEGNLQRLLGGENWEETDLAPLFAELTAADWQAVQAIWDYFETYRPAIAAKERRVNGIEPQWVAPTPFAVRSADGQIVEMRGGYYPIRYDTQASERAAEDDAASAVQAQMRGVHSAATTRRGHTKSRVQEVHNRPLVYNFAGIYSGFSDVIHDLAWHEYLIDANKLLRATRLQNAIKDHYGTDVLRQFKTWIQDIAVGDNETLAAGEDALRTVRRYASMAGLAFNVVSALKQPLGILQSVARVGGQDILGATAQFIRNPVAMTREAQGASPFMQNRARTRFRELNELRNALEQQGAIRQTMSRYGYVLIMAVQQQVDVITWHAQLNKSLRAGADIQDAVAHADQAVIDSQGSGMTKDLAAIERGGEWRKLFTVYYGFMNTVLNLEVNALTSKRSLGYKAGTVLMLSVAMPIIDAALSDLLKPGDSDDWDEDHWQASVGKAVANSLTGHFFALRELQFGGRSYSGPTGTRSIADAYKLGAQVLQGELDAGFRRALINTAGSWYGLPAAQINRSWDGFEALDDGKTDNPLALIFGYQEKK